MRRTAHALALGLTLAAIPGRASAQASAPPAGSASGAAPAADAGKAAPPLLDAAKRYYDDAIRFYQAGQYDAARAAFEASFALSKEPDLLYNLSTTAEKQGQLADAIRYAERYLEGKPNAEDTEQVRERIARLRAQSGQPAPTLEPPKPSAAPAAPMRTPEAAAVTAVQKNTAASSSTFPKPAAALLGAGAVLLLGGVGTGAAALATARQVAGLETIYFSELQAFDQRGNALNTAAITLSVIGGAAAVAGAGWLIAWKARSR